MLTKGTARIWGLCEPRAPAARLRPLPLTRLFNWGARGAALALHLGDWECGDSLILLVFLPFGLGSNPGFRIPPKPTAKDLCWRLNELAHVTGGLYVTYFWRREVWVSQSTPWECGEALYRRLYIITGMLPKLDWSIALSEWIYVRALNLKNSNTGRIQPKRKRYQTNSM